MSKSGARIGLSFLETVLRQNHTRRLTEEIVFDLVGVADRRIRQEISLSFLHPNQIDAGQEYSTFRSATAPAGDREESTQLWIPLARVSRFSSPPVTVTARDGNVLPTLTRGESSELLAAAIYRLFRRILELYAAVDESDKIRRLVASEHETRWLLQQAVMALVVERAPVTKPHHRPPTPGTQPATGARQRQLLKEVLDKLYELGGLDDVLRLLEIAMDETLLIAAFDLNLSDHEVTYALPIRRLDLNSGRVRRTSRTTDFVIDYRSVVPSGVRSYHLTASAASPSTEVRDAAMLIPSAREHVQRITTDLEFLADAKLAYDAGQLSDIEGKLLEYEMQNTLKALADLLRRRTWEADWQDDEISPSELKCAQVLADVGSSGEGVVVKQPEPKVRASLLLNAQVTHVRLLQASKELESTGLGTEVCLDTTNESANANVFWRRNEVGSDPRRDLPAVCRFRLVDRVSDGMRSVRQFGSILIAITYLVSAGSYASPWPWDWAGYSDPVSEVDAKVAILLLVPGFLFTRFDLPPRGSIGARLRAWPRFIAYLYIGTAVATAVVLAAAPNERARGWCSVAILMIQTALLLMLIPPRMVPLGEWTLGSVIDFPRWTIGTQRVSRLLRQADVSFQAVGIENEHT